MGHYVGQSNFFNHSKAFFKSLDLNTLKGYLETMFSSRNSRMLEMANIMGGKDPKPTNYASLTVNFFDSSYDYEVLKDKPLPPNREDKKGNRSSVARSKKKIRALFLIDPSGFLLYPLFSINDGNGNSDRDLIESLVNLPNEYMEEPIFIESELSHYYEDKKGMDSIRFTTVRTGVGSENNQKFLGETFQKSHQPIVKFAKLFERFSKIRAASIKDSNNHEACFVVATILFNIKRMAKLSGIEVKELHKSWRLDNAGYRSMFVQPEPVFEFSNARYDDSEKIAQGLMEDFLKKINMNEGLGQSQTMAKDQSQDSGVGHDDL